MKHLMKKEISLSMHPTTLLFLMLSCLLLVPNYPYDVVFFFTSLGIFFTCLSGRENNDIVYTIMLPVAKRDIVRARFRMVVLIEAAQMVLAVPFSIIRQRMPIPQNAVGLSANIAFFGSSFVLLGIFNLIFFCIYYSNVAKVGKAFGWASVGIFVYVVAAETSAHVVPFVRDRLNTRDPQFLGEKLTALAIGIILYTVLTVIAYRKSTRSFEALDL